MQTRTTTITEREPEWFSPAELAEWLGIPRASIYQWRHRGVGPRGVHVGKHVRFRRSVVEAWLETQADPDDGAAGQVAGGSVSPH